MCAERPTGHFFLFYRKRLRRSCNRTAQNMTCVHKRISAPMQPASNHCRRRHQRHLRPAWPRSVRAVSAGVASSRGFLCKIQCETGHAPPQWPRGAAPHLHGSRGMPRIPCAAQGSRGMPRIPLPTKRWAVGRTGLAHCGSSGPAQAFGAGHFPGCGEVGDLGHIRMRSVCSMCWYQAMSV